MVVSTNTNHTKDQIINDLRQRRPTEKELDRLKFIAELLLQQQRGEKTPNINFVR